MFRLDLDAIAVVQEAAGGQRAQRTAILAELSRQIAEQDGPKGELAEQMTTLIADHKAMREAGEEMPEIVTLAKWADDYIGSGLEESGEIAAAITERFRPIVARLRRERDEARAANPLTNPRRYGLTLLNDGERYKWTISISAEEAAKVIERVRGGATAEKAYAKAYQKGVGDTSNPHSVSSEPWKPIVGDLRARLDLANATAATNEARLVSRFVNDGPKAKGAAPGAKGDVEALLERAARVAAIRDCGADREKTFVIQDLAACVRAARAFLDGQDVKPSEEESPEILRAALRAETARAAKLVLAFNEERAKLHRIFTAIEFTLGDPSDAAHVDRVVAEAAGLRRMANAGAGYALDDLRKEREAHSHTRAELAEARAKLDVIAQAMGGGE